MSDANKGLSFFTNIFYHLMKFVTRFNIPVLILIALITVFFSYEITNLKINVDEESFASGVEENIYVQTPAQKPAEGENLVYISPSEQVRDIPHYGYSERAESEKLKVDIPPQIGIKAGSYPDEYALLFTSDLLYTPEVLTLLETVKNQISSLDFAGPCLSPFDFVTVEKNGSRLSLIPMNPLSEGAVWDDESVSLFQKHLMNDTMARGYLLSNDGNSIMLYWRMDHYSADEIELLNAIIDPLRDYGRVCVIGNGIISDRVTYYIERDLTLLCILCFLIILLTYYLAFRNKRSILVLFSMSLMGIIWTFGTMALMGYKLTLISILTPCLVLILGSSYSIRIMSEYFSAARYQDHEKMNIAYARIAKAILSAALTTIIGFTSMLICRTELLREFGVSVSIGVSYCALLAIVYLPAIFSVQRFPSQQRARMIENGVISKTVDIIIKVTLKYWGVVLLVVVLIFFGFMYAKDRVGFNANYMEYFPSDDVFVNDALYFAHTMGGTTPYYMTIKAPDEASGFFLQPENLKKVYEFEKTVLASSTDIIQVFSFSQYVSFLNQVYTGKEGIPDNAGMMNFLYRFLLQFETQLGAVLSLMINEDASEMTLLIRNFDSYEQDLTTAASSRRVEEMLDYYRYLLPVGTTSRIYGTSSDMLKASDMMRRDQSIATLLSLIGIIIITTFILKSFFKGLVSVIPVAIGIMFSQIFMCFAGIPFDLVTIGCAAVTIGIGIDSAMRFLFRYKLLKRENPDMKAEDIIRETLKETGREIILTSLAFVAGLIVLLFASYVPIQHFGLLMIVSLTVSMLATLFVLPVVMLLSNRVKDRLSKSR